jgi:hypothetical protein
MHSTADRRLWRRSTRGRLNRLRAPGRSSVGPPRPPAPRAGAASVTHAAGNARLQELGRVRLGDYWATAAGSCGVAKRCALGRFAGNSSPSGRRDLNSGPLVPQSNPAVWRGVVSSGEKWLLCREIATPAWHFAASLHAPVSRCLGADWARGSRFPLPA